MAALDEGMKPGPARRRTGAARARATPWLCAGALALLGACDDDSPGPPDALIDGGDGTRDVAADGDAAEVGDATEVGETGADAAPLTEAQSFTTTATVTLTPRGPYPGRAIPPVSFEMLLRLDPVAGKLTIAQRGSAEVVNVRRTSEATFEADEVPLPIPRTGDHGAAITVTKLVIGVSRAWLTAAGSGAAEVIFGDVRFPYDGVLSLAGPRDTTGPELGPNTGADPLGDLFLPTSEPVPAGTTARLVASAHRLDLLSEGAGMVLAFRKGAALALRYDTTYQVEVDGWRDLAQNPGRPPLPTVATPPAPILIAEGGFESEAGMLGGATVVEAPALPVISGTKSVFIRSIYSGPLPITNRFTVRLVRQPNDTVVHVTVRPFANFSGPHGTYGVKIRVAAPGGAIVDSPLPTSETTTTRIGGYLFGEPRTITIPLPPATDSEFVFDMGVDLPAMGFPSTPPPSYLIDDLSVD